MLGAPKDNAVVHMVTGGLGFIGSHLVTLLLERNPSAKVVIVDLLTYAAHPSFFGELRKTYGPRVTMEIVDIRDHAEVSRVMRAHEVNNVFHLAAESHVCRSLEGPDDFYTTNILGTHVLTQAFLNEVQPHRNGRFLHVSTDEVFGELPLNDGSLFNEQSPIAPRSPYATSKACSDLVVQTAVLTWGLRAVTTNCSNNFGPRQHGEKLVPKTIGHILRGEPVPLYGGGRSVRDWISVTDHCEGIVAALEEGVTGERYCLGGETEIDVKDMVWLIHDLVQEFKGSDVKLVTASTEDRPNDDLRYAIDNSKARERLGWKPEKGQFREKMAATVAWYIRQFEEEHHVVAGGRGGLGEKLPPQVEDAGASR